MRPACSTLLVLLMLAGGSAVLADDVSDAVTRARRLHEGGDAAGAVEALRALRRDHPDRPDPMPFLAYLLVMEEGALEEASDLLDDYLEFVPGNDYALGLLGNVADRALDRGDPELARSCAKVLMREVPGDREHKYLWALCSFRMGDHGAVRGAARELIADAPSFAPAYWLLATSLEEEGRYKDAVDTYRDLLRERSGDSVARMRMANVLLWNLRDFDGAEQAYRDAVEISDRESRAYLDAKSGLQMARAERDRTERLRSRYRSLGSLLVWIAAGWAALLVGLFFLTRPR